MLNVALGGFEKAVFYIGVKSGLSGGKGTAFMCMCQDIRTHGVCRNIHAGEAASY